MPFRIYDWECGGCNSERECVVSYETGKAPPLRQPLYCHTCKAETEHRRLLALPGPYYGEKVLNPLVSGGQFDTAGYERAPMPKYPDPSIPFEGRVDYYRSKEHKEIMKERKEIIGRNKAKRRRAELIKRGENINIRRDKLPGDPKVLS